MNLDIEYDADAAASRLAAAIGEPARARILYCLMDGHARTSTELALVAGVSPSTASAHLNRLTFERLIKATAQGKHRYYCLYDPAVAGVLEHLSVLAGAVRAPFVPRTPVRLRAARTCYDHMAGALAVALHDRLMSLHWLAVTTQEATDYDVGSNGVEAFKKLGIDLEGERARRRRFAYACLDWSERRPHVGGAVGAALLALALRKRWVAQEFDSRSLSITPLGQRELSSCLGLRV